MRYYIIAGEASGDLHGANLIRALRRLDAGAEFRIVGGDRMQRESGEAPLIHIAQMAFMGFVEVLANIKAISRNLRAVKADIAAYAPDTVVLIDFPGFNLKIASFAKQSGFKVCYYISPKVWAWNQRRVLKIKRVVDRLFCILPFEVDFYKQWGMDVDYVGNPLLDAIANHTANPDFLSDNGLSHKPIIAFLPGSRKMEISKLLPIMGALSFRFPGHQCIVAGAPNFDLAYYRQYLGEANLPIVSNATYDLLAHAEAAVVASGTATLETALLNVPQVVVYKAHPLSIAIARLVIKVKHISLVNLILDKPAVKELIQQECTAASIADELDELLNNNAHRGQVLADYGTLHEKMGQPGASERTAERITAYLSEA